MGSVLIRFKVLPKEATTDLEEMARSIEQKLPQGATIRRVEKEPIAFGLFALILDIQAAEEEGTMEKLETTLRSSEHVGEIDVVGVSRLSTKLK